MGRLAVIASLLASLALSQDAWDRPITITGSVIDENGIPVEEADVSVRLPVRPLLTTAQRRAAFDSSAGSATTDAAGHFEIALAPWTLAAPEAPLTLVVSKDGRVGPPVLVDQRFRGSHHDVSLEFREGDKPCWRRIVDQEGTPLANTRVAALISVNTRRGCCAISMPDYSNLLVGLETRSDRDGLVNFSNAAVLALVAGRGDVTPVRIEPEKPELDLVVRAWFHPESAAGDLTPVLTAEGPGPRTKAEAMLAFQEKFAGAASVEGLVLDPSGQPLEGAEVAVVAHDAQLDPLASLRIQSQRALAPFSRTDARGRFRVPRLAGGRYRLSVAGPQLAPKLTAPFQLRDGAVHAAGKLQLERGARLLVRHSMGWIVIGPAGRWWDYPVYLDLDGPDGEVLGLGEGSVDVRSHNGGCIASAPESVRVPSKGDVVLDFEDKDPGRDRRNLRTRP